MTSYSRPLPHSPTPGPAKLTVVNGGSDDHTADRLTATRTRVATAGLILGTIAGCFLPWTAAVRAVASIVDAHDVAAGAMWVTAVTAILTLPPLGILTIKSWLVRRELRQHQTRTLCLLSPPNPTCDHLWK
jgi:hypothetical protein